MLWPLVYSTGYSAVTDPVKRVEGEEGEGHHLQWHKTDVVHQISCPRPSQELLKKAAS